jgi:beta-1,4-N-acetylglucosaminyltransferase
MSQTNTRRTLFVTVGTTLFEALIEGTTTDSAIEWMCHNGYTHLIVQYGKGKIPQIPNIAKYNQRIAIETFDFKPSLQQYMIDADTIICHAGAGTVMEALKLQKRRLIVVINTILMDNHQIELADAMSVRNHLFVIHSPQELITNFTKVWSDIESFQSTIYSGGNEYDVPQILDNFFGFATKYE